MGTKDAEDGNRGDGFACAAEGIDEFILTAQAARAGAGVSIGLFKLAAISTDEITDAEVLTMFLDLTIESEEDITDAFGILGRHRPAIVAKLESMLRRRDR